MASAGKTERISIWLLFATLIWSLPLGCGEATVPAKPESEGESPMLTLSSGTEIKDPSDEDIRNALESLNIERDGEGFAILAPAEMTYIQVGGDSKIGFDLEYQEGSTDEHYRAKREDYTLNEVVKILIAFRDGNVRWEEVGDFERITW
jgi:hypothetical protein